MQFLQSAPADADAELIAGASRGEAWAFAAIMRRHNRLLFRSAQAVLGDEAEAQDVVQETYLRALTRLDTFRGESALGTWLARIAINLALDAQRRRARTVPLADAREPESEDTEDPMTAFSAPTADAPYQAAERSEVRELLQRAIASLPPIYRSVFMLRAVEELSVDETAYCLQVSDAVVKTRYLRARALLRDALGTQVEPHVQEVYAFAGARCDAIVSEVLSALRRQGRIAPG